MKIENTKELRSTILDRIEGDGVNLREFTEAQQIEIIKMYAAVILAVK